MMISRVLRYCCLALAACVGTLAFAATPDESRFATFGAVLLDQGNYGVASTKFTLEQAYVGDSADSRLCSSTAGLLKNSHGFLQATADEVAKGTTGSTVSLFLS